MIWFQGQLTNVLATHEPIGAHCFLWERPMSKIVYPGARKTLMEVINEIGNDLELLAWDPDLPDLEHLAGNEVVAK